MANPFLALGAVAAVAVGAAVGFIAVPGWVAQAQDSLAIGDLGAIRDAQSAYYDIKGEWALDLPTLAADPEWGTAVELSQGVTLRMDVTAKGWCAATRSESGKFFGTSTNHLAIKDGASEEDVLEVVCDGIVDLVDPTGATLSIARTGDHPNMALTATVSQGVCQYGTAQYRIASRYTDTAAEREWGGWGWSTERTLTVRPAFAGALYEFKAQVKCVRGADESATIDVAPKTYLTPIPTPAPTLDVKAQGEGLRATAAASCYADTTPQYGFRYRSAISKTFPEYGAFSKWDTKNTLDVTSLTPGARYQVEVQARCVTERNQSEAGKASGYLDAVMDSVFPTTTMTVTVSGSNAVSKLTTTCSAPLTTAYQQQRDTRLTGDAVAWGTTSTTASVSAAVDQGARVDARGRIRCESPWGMKSGWSPWAKGNTVRAITTKPTVTSPKVALVTTNDAELTASLGACPAGTGYVAQYRGKLNGTGSWILGDFKAAKAGSNTWKWAANMYQGAQFQMGATAYCSTPWADGPKTTADAAPKVRPIDTVPSAEAIAKLDKTDGQVTANIKVIDKCPTGTTFYWRYQSIETGGEYSAWKPTDGTTLDKDGILSWYSATGAKNARKIKWENKATVKVHYLCATPFAKSASDKQNATTPVREIPTPKAEAVVKLDDPTGQVTVGVKVLEKCPDGTTFRWRYQSRENSGDYSAWKPNSGTAPGAGAIGDWYTSSKTVNARKIGYADKATAKVQYICATSYAKGSSATVTATTAARAIPAASATALATLNQSSGAMSGGVSVSTACPTGTTFRWRVTGQQGSGTWTAWKPNTSAASDWYSASGSSNMKYIRDIGYGYNGRVEVQYACAVGDKKGPVKEAFKTTSTRALPKPAAPTSVKITKLYAGENGRGIAQAAWSSGKVTYASKYQSYARVFFSGGYTKDKTVPDSTSPSFGLGCYGDGTRGLLALQVYVKAVNSTGSSAWSGSAKKEHNGDNNARLCS